MSLSEKKKQITVLIKNNDKSISFYKPKLSTKSSPVWHCFSIVVLNGIKQELVICDVCKILLTYRCKDGTNSLAKHKRSCENSAANSNTTTNNQTKVTEYYVTSKTYDIPKHIKEKVKLACTEFVAFDSRPFEVVSGDGFIKLAQSIFDAGKYFNRTSNVNIKELIPSSITISRNIDNLYEQKKSELVQFCSSMKTYCIICDFWTERYTGLSYCGLALRHISSDFNLYNLILGCVLYDIESQSANNVRMFVEAQLLLYGLNLSNNIFVVTDNENKMKACFRNNCTRIGCAIHYLNKQLEHSFTSLEIDKQPVDCQAVQNIFKDVKKICTHVRRTHRQIKLQKKLQLYSDTRFSGAFYMLHVFNNVYDELGGILDNQHMCYLATIDKDQLGELCDFLVIFDQAINELNEEERPTIHKVVPIRQLLLDHCEISPEDSSGLEKLKIFLLPNQYIYKHALQKVSARLCNMGTKIKLSTFYSLFYLGKRIDSAWVPQDQHLMATLLHPSLKHFDKQPNEKLKALDLVKQELKRRTPTVPVDDKFISTSSTTTSNTSITTKSTTNDLMTRCFDQPKSTSISNSKQFDELEAYMALNVQIRETDNVLVFWKENEKNFPILSAIVRDIFAIPSSNTIVERLFSSSKYTVTDRRTSLGSEKLNKLLFLKKNTSTLQQIQTKSSKINSEQSKRKLSTFDDQLVSSSEDEDDDNSTYSSLFKKTKTNYDYNYSSDEIETVDVNSI